MKYIGFYPGQEFISLFVAAVLIFVCVPVHADGINKQLRKAAKRGDVTAIQDLLDEGANIETRNRKGYSPLHLAAKRSYTAIVQALLAAGADTKPQNDSGNTALDLASKKDNTDSVELIKIGDLAHAVTIDMPKSRGLTAEKFRNVARLALRKRGWAVVQESDDRIDA